MDAATKSPEPSFSATESEGSQEAVETVKPKKSSDAADVDAVAMLLGLSQQEGSDEGTAGGQRGASRAKRPLPTSTVAVADLPGITKKGASRLGPADNRVRPPKAATKLLPEAKWRHIRLPDVQMALEAEDLVVLWAHYQHPEQLPRTKAESHLNFVPSHYDEKELRYLLKTVNTAFELEDLLKERFGVGSHSKKPRTAGPAGNGSGSPSAPLSPTAIQSEGDQTAPAASSLPRQSSHELAGLMYIGAGLKDGVKQAKQAQQAVDNGGGAEGEGIVPGVGEEAMDAEAAPAEKAEKESEALAGEAAAGEGDGGGEKVEVQLHQRIGDAEQLDAATALEPKTVSGSAAPTAVTEAASAAAAAPAAGETSGVMEEGVAKAQVDALAAAQQAQHAQELQQLQQQLQQQQLQLQQQQAELQVAAALVAVPSHAATAAAAAGGAAPSALPAMPSFDPAQFLAQQQQHQQQMTSAAGLDAAFMQQHSDALAALAAGGGADGLAGLDPSALLAAAAGGSLQLPGGIPGLGGGFSFGPNGLSSFMQGFALFNNPLQWPAHARASQHGDHASNGGTAAGGPHHHLNGLFPPALNFQMPPGVGAAAGNPTAGLESLGFAPPGLIGAAGGGNGTQGGMSGSLQVDGIGDGGDDLLGRKGSGGGPAIKFAAGDRPGRPPSYDEMVRWCVDLKRCLWQRHVPLTIEEAVAMVNNPDHFTTGGVRTIGDKARVLVASTLRKRVLGIFKITWSQVATDSDPAANEETQDASVQGAAAAKLKRQGMDPGRSGQGLRGMARSGNATTAATASGGNGNIVASAAAAAAMQHAMAQMPHHAMMGGSGAPAMTQAQVQQDNVAAAAARNAAAMAAAFAMPPASLPAGLGVAGFPGLLPAQLSGLPSTAMAQPADAFRADAGFSIPLSTVALTLPPQLQDMVVRGQAQFLSTEEVCALLMKGVESLLPVSTTPAVRPPPGSMFLYDKNATLRFRCDGYEWKHSEKHAKRKFGEETKLNCYYVGDSEDVVQRRCYWLLDESESSLVLVHYQPPPVGKGGDGGSVSDEEEAEGEGERNGEAVINGIGSKEEGGQQIGSGEEAGGALQQQQQQQQRAAMPPASMDLHKVVAVEVRETVEPERQGTLFEAPPPVPAIRFCTTGHGCSDTFGPRQYS